MDGRSAAAGFQLLSHRRFSALSGLVTEYLTRVSDQTSDGPIFGRASWTNDSSSRSGACTSEYLSLCATCKLAMTWRALCTTAPYQRKAKGLETAVIGQNAHYSTLVHRNGYEHHTAFGFEIPDLCPFR